jgi:hypothetical protein
MKLDYLKEKGHLVPFALLGVSALLAVLTLVKVVDFFVTSAKAGSVVRKAVEQNKSDEDDVEKHLAKAKAMADDLKKRNLFVPVPPKRNPVSVVLGIFGDEALINDKWYRAGDSVGDAKIVAIEPTQVRIEWDGKEKVFAPITASVASGPSGPARAGRPGRGDSERPEPSMVVSEAGRGPGRGGFGDLSEEQRAQMRARFEGMRDRFQNMSPEERERFREEMRGRFGGGMRGPGGGDRGSGGSERRPGGGGRGGR